MATSLFVNKKTIEVSSDDEDRDSFDSPRRPHSGYATRYREKQSVRSPPSHLSGSDYNSDSTVEEIVQRALQGHYGRPQKEYQTALLFNQKGARPATRPSLYTRSNPIQLPGQRRRPGLLGDALSSDHSGLSSSSDAQADEEYVARVHRELRCMSESPPQQFTKPSLRVRREKYGKEKGEERTIGKRGVKLDEKAVNRLTAPNKAMKARQTEKYEKKKEREEAEAAARRRRQPPDPHPLSLAAGKRLYLQAEALRRDLEEKQKEKTEREKENEEEYPFQPTLSRYTRHLTEDGYVPVSERADDARERLERLRLEKEAAGVRELTFHPTLSPGSRQIVAESRAPFGDVEVGERLYAEGGERLIRDQVRRRREEQRAQRQTVGRRTISPRQVEELTERMRQWQEEREARRLQLLQASEAASTSPSTGPTKTSTTNPKTDLRFEAVSLRPLPSLHYCHHHWEEEKRVHTPVRVFHPHQHQAPSLTRSASVGAPSPYLPSKHIYYSENKTLSRSPSVSTEREGVHFKDNEAMRFAVLRNPLYQEMRAIRFGALFFKYAPTHSNTVTLGQIHSLVEQCYPEDRGVWSALVDQLRAVEKEKKSVIDWSPRRGQSNCAVDHVVLDKPRFVSLLQRYESLHGAQPWARTEKDSLLFPIFPSSSPPLPTTAPSLEGSVGWEGKKKVEGAAEVRRTPRGTSLPSPTSDGKILLQKPTTVYSPSDFQQCRALTERIQHGDKKKEEKARYTVTAPEKSAKEVTAAIRAKTRSGATLEKKPKTLKAEPKPQSEGPPPPRPSSSVSDPPNSQRGKKALTRSRCGRPASRPRASIPSRPSSVGTPQRKRGAEKVSSEELYSFQPSLGQRTIELSKMNEEKRRNYFLTKKLREKELTLLLEKQKPSPTTAAVGGRRGVNQKPPSPVPQESPSDAEIRAIPREEEKKKTPIMEVVGSPASPLRTSTTTGGSAKEGRSPSIELSSLSSEDGGASAVAVFTIPPATVPQPFHHTSPHRKERSPEQYTNLEEVEAELREMDSLFDALYRKAHAL